MNSVSCGNGKLRQWLIDQIDSGKYPGLVWENDEKSIFRIPWKHAGKQDYNREEDAALFKVRLSLGLRLWSSGRAGGMPLTVPSSPPASAGWFCWLVGCSWTLPGWWRWLCPGVPGLWDSPPFHNSMHEAKCFWDSSTSVSTFIPLSYAH